MTPRALALLLLAATALAACSGDDEPDPSQAATPLPAATTATPATTAPPAAAAPPTTAARTPSSSATSAAPVETVPANPRPCATSALRITLSGAGAAAGTRGFVISFVNTGTSTCALDGHPGVSIVTGPDGTQVGASARRQGQPARVTLAPSAAAHAELFVTRAGNDDKATCVPTPGRGFRVYPPDQRESAFVQAQVVGCAARSVALLRVGPVVAGSAPARGER